MSMKSWDDCRVSAGGVGRRGGTSMLSHAVWWKSSDALTCRRLKEARECLLESLRLSEQEDQPHAKFEALFAFATFLHKEESDLELAEKIYQQLLDAEGEKVEVLNSYALLMHTGTNQRWEDAEELYERALELDPHHAPTLSNYAMLQGERTDGRGSYKSTMFLYERAMANSPKEVKETQEKYEIDAL
ncbi:hypothetical protein GUITHDRAFT_108538 [Guillardia theta CCMP2712]|uniref:Uncharacterized protein n=1 Tax=Guillardia theta (strain CCMP2712) TaxID=905079 RepID=L1JAV4_GUITC|nr:hypothetical protein GUITHDRAFT_108538 [Guillardia theta CCMP2712]EKX45661.1 hypothetical protein GUITHDRAFT_108538 [Guillardia theta CCMP2712]|eukprot:XP_005832641.1 hypothetical protein GUITHDRAFT_108538 [Guillardia theta CCMP2712]